MPRIICRNLRKRKKRLDFSRRRSGEDGSLRGYFRELLDRLLEEGHGLTGEFACQNAASTFENGGSTSISRRAQSFPFQLPAAIMGRALVTVNHRDRRCDKWIINREEGSIGSRSSIFIPPSDATRKKYRDSRRISTPPDIFEAGTRLANVSLLVSPFSSPRLRRRYRNRCNYAHVERARLVESRIRASQLIRVPPPPSAPDCDDRPNEIP